MKHSSTFLLWTLCTSVALAEPAVTQAVDSQAAAALVRRQLLEPLQKSESRRRVFSRAAPVALERRVRIIDAPAQTDPHGRNFVRFAVDARHPGAETTWSKGVFTGCVYPADGRVFVLLGADYLPAAAISGEDAEPVKEVCRAADAA